jgi:hypothetical protein
MTLERIVEASVPSGEIARRAREVYRSILPDFASRGGASFTVLSARDCERLLRLYDRIVFRGGLHEKLADRPVRFRVSSRMTAAAGKTFHRRFRAGAGGAARDEYEIAISATLLFQTFRDVERSITVSGIECRNRLEALQRIFEHELVHLVEILLWNRSSCSADRFQCIAERLFGHKAHTHQLITPRERAWRRFGIRPGDRVAFHVNGERLEGFVNRITRRATVLVEDESGARYSDGKRYARFYVPLSMLDAADSSTREG